MFWFHFEGDPNTPKFEVNKLLQSALCRGKWE